MKIAKRLRNNGLVLKFNIGLGSRVDLVFMHSAVFAGNAIDVMFMNDQDETI